MIHNRVLIFDTTPARRRAVARHLAERAGEARDRPAARAARRRRDRGRLPDHLARRLRGRAGDRPDGRGPGDRRSRAHPLRRHRRRLERRAATANGRGSTRSSRPPTSTSSTSCRRTREDVKGQARAAVAHARQYLEDVEFSPMDATRVGARVHRRGACRSRSTRARPRSTSRTPSATRCRTSSPAYLERLYELVPGPARRRAVGPLPRRPRARGRQLVRRPAGRRAPGRVRGQRHRRARRQRLARGDRDAAAHRASATSACTPAS